MTDTLIPFNRPHMTGKELGYIADAHAHGKLAGDGPYTKKCHEWLEQNAGGGKALLTHSCTAGLEMAAILSNVEPGDEVIMPSFTFVSTANAFVLRGAIPVFVDIRPDTLNIDETLIEAAITPRTRAIVPVHYAGVGCEMDTIMAIAERHQLLVIEDAAQGLMATYKGRPLGSIGHLAAFSFHETKNVICGEGGALMINDPRFHDRAEIIREKGTNRSQFFRGQVDKYTWCDIGSSFLPGELVAAFLWAQLQDARAITDKRLRVWDAYHAGLEGLERDGKIQRPVVHTQTKHNAHMYYVLLHDLEQRTRLISRLSEKGINSVFHYVPLHSSPAGQRYARTSGSLARTVALSDRLVRLPLWADMDAVTIETVIDAVKSIVHSN
ncbi:dTDP-4-amino-4,6-dideoxygalactose transaminase [Paraburkholderia hospita]|uniref:dTDP-4-amino-4,6-dideoxygalactose transaminase n=1 Tax=Paraburkholderia hospita TaxID=169430 RepID=UPI000B342223|nr:dTDP-4-amino-4,6-dideoxygalactose transaminase [Paraburkholderia hospita]OUL88676.1 dTDP-4-amino-4,6-dideoxygalactose transaminase [Paraburkholderia hospita]